MSTGGWTVRPDFASVNFSEDGAADVGRLLLSRGIGVEAGIATVADAETAIASGLLDRCLGILVEVPEEDPGRLTYGGS